MKKLLLSLSLLTYMVNTFGCMNIQNQSSTDNNLIGFVFVKIYTIYTKGGNACITSTEIDTLLCLTDKQIHINGNKYDIMEEDYLYKDQVDIEVFAPEYSLFILRCIQFTDDYYKVLINNTVGFIKKGDLCYFKDVNTYLMEVYPIPTKENPLRDSPNDNAKIINGFDEWIYTSIEVKGDWLMIKDDKDCFINEEPSPLDIIGWIRWRKDGKFIIKVAHSC